MKKIHTAETSSGAYKTASNEEKKLRHEIAMEIDRFTRMIEKEDITSNLYVEFVVMRYRLMTILHG